VCGALRYIARLCDIVKNISPVCRAGGEVLTDTLDKMQQRIEYDMAYIRQWTLWLDVRIILKTIFNGFSNRNAY